MDSSLQRVVHLDLKACPFKIPYLEKIMHLFKSWGVTGLLIEWEDSFPYSNKLSEIGSLSSAGPKDGLYTVEEVKMIINMAKTIGLEIIQLVQSYGHMEFVLKHPRFMHLREVELCPSVLCPATTEAQLLVATMLHQVLELQPEAKYIHIGGDEVWHMNVCEDCEKVPGVNGTATALELYIRHVRLVTAPLRATKPHLRILMWDDMVRNAPIDLVKAYELSTMIVPVISDYNMVSLDLDWSHWEKYAAVFPSLWSASVYKGAASSQQIIVPVERYVSNQEAWVKEINRYKGHVNLSGIILTGWSRFDHFATICELLPLALPCLALCMQTLMTNGAQVSYKEDTLPPITWPGQELIDAVKSYAALRDKSYALLRGDLIGAWMNPWQLRHRFTNPLQVEGVAIAAHEFLVELEALEPILRNNLLSITGNRTTTEWMGTNVTSLHQQLTEAYEIANERANTQPGIHPV